MKRLTGVVAALVLAACGTGTGSGNPAADKFRNGVPAKDSVKLNVPGSVSQAPLTGQGTRRDGLEGDTAQFYTMTRDVSVMVNGATVSVLTLIEKITENDPTSISGNTAVWGPGGDALSPNRYKLTVTETATNQFTYALEGKAKTEADSAFRVILSGSHTSTGNKLGSGTFLLDFDKAHQLPEHGSEVGLVEISYSKVSSTATIEVQAAFHQVADHGQLVDAAYLYNEVPNQGGALNFALAKDMVPGAAIELMTIHSRWLQSGAGRADVKITGGDLNANQATANECWDANFASRFFNVSFDATKNYGAETVCAFSAAEYATP